jgi:hypothetical protein
MTHHIVFLALAFQVCLHCQSIVESLIYF